MLLNGGDPAIGPVPEIGPAFEERPHPSFTSVNSPRPDGTDSGAQPGDTKPKIVIQGWYGNGNLGDEVILECMLSELRGHFPGASFVVISDDPEDTRRRHGVESIVRGGSRIQRLRRFQTLADANLFVLGGGELLKQYGSSDLSVLTWLGPLELAHEMGVPTMTYALGVSDRLSPRAEAAMKDTLSKTDAVLVRDQQSLDVLKRVGVAGATLTADPAILSPELHPSGRRQASPDGLRVSVFVNQWFVTRSVVPDLEAWERFKKSLAECVDTLIESYRATVRFIPMQVAEIGEDDRAVAREIAGLARNRDLVEVREGEVSAEEVISLISESNLVIGMRLHSLILAASLGVPAVGIEYQSKVRRFCYSIGTSDWTVGIMDSSPDLIQNLCKRVILGEYPLAQVRERVHALQDLARENARVAAALISRPRSRSNRISRMARGSIEVARRALGKKEQKQAPESVIPVNALEPNHEGETSPSRSAPNGRVGQA